MARFVVAAPVRVTRSMLQHLAWGWRKSTASRPGQQATVTSTYLPCGRRGIPSRRRSCCLRSRAAIARTLAQDLAAHIFAKQSRSRPAGEQRQRRYAAPVRRRERRWPLDMSSPCRQPDADRLEPARRRSYFSRMASARLGYRPPSRGSAQLQQHRSPTLVDHALVEIRPFLHHQQNRLRLVREHGPPRAPPLHVPARARLSHDQLTLRRATTLAPLDLKLQHRPSGGPCAGSPRYRLRSTTKASSAFVRRAPADPVRLSGDRPDGDR